ncbi:MAG: hypothetical protein FJX25_00465 [Alphaproteobacteria bacterium]|nr:hypothetical protein [Alphaproteobacteria bacterium]
MKAKLWVAMLTVSLLGGCSSVLTDAIGGTQELPEEVVALAAPNQNIATARLQPDDNCYWYEHVGPVETTLLPLISERGGPICLAEG